MIRMISSSNPTVPPVAAAMNFVVVIPSTLESEPESLTSMKGREGGRKGGKEEGREGGKESKGWDELYGITGVEVIW